MAGPRRIDWGTAVVEDCTLEVELTRSRSKDWSARFERVVALLETPHSGWGRVRLAKNRLRVKDATEGAEAELRHFLESAVIEANSELDGDGEPDRRATEEGDRDPAAERDRRMTETFRAFAAEQREPAR